VGLRPFASWDYGFKSRRGHGCLCLVSDVYCQVEISASDWSLVQRSPTECGVSEWDHESSIMKRPWPTGGLLHHSKTISFPEHGDTLTSETFIHPQITQTHITDGSIVHSCRIAVFHVYYYLFQQDIQHFSVSPCFNLWPKMLIGPYPANVENMVNS